MKPMAKARHAGIAAALAVAAYGATIATPEANIQTARADSSGDCLTKSKKKLNDTQASLVNLTPVNTSIRALVALPPHHVSGHRFLPLETTTYAVHGRVVFVKHQLDSDIHLVLRYGKRTMITEAPAPRCSAGSLVLTQITAVRRAIRARFPHIAPGGMRVSVPVTVTGVGYFDTVHGQVGVARNESSCIR
jgi:hypothetical protein